MVLELGTVSCTKLSQNCFTEKQLNLYYKLRQNDVFILFCFPFSYQFHLINIITALTDEINIISNDEYGRVM